MEINKKGKMSKIKVFISSTMEDMQKEREAVKTALERLDFIEPIFAESFPAQPHSPKKVCLDEVKNSHIYVGIFKDRYGWVPQVENPERLSVTAIEYHEAVRNNIPTLIFRVFVIYREKRLCISLSERVL